MLFIDQFEELLTICRDAGEQSAFTQVLCALSDSTTSSTAFCCRILLTLRTDHLARFETNNALKPLHMRLVGENNQRYLSAIGFGDIKRAIKEPADEAGLRFIPATLLINSPARPRDCRTDYRCCSSLCGASGTRGPETNAASRSI